MLEKMFKLKQNNTNVKTEVLAGLTTFMTMAYILAVNPAILGATGMNPQAVLIATALAAFIGTLLMAFLANYPFALAPGMGLNAYFAYTIVINGGYSWQFALLAVMIEGIVFVILSLTNVREAIFNAIPRSLKSGVSVGIGLFIAFIGFKDAYLIINDDATLVTYQKFNGGPETVAAVIGFIGILLTAIFVAKQIRGGILLGIVVTWIIGIVAEVANIYVPDPSIGFYSVIPEHIFSFDFTALGDTFGQVFNTGAWGNFNIIDLCVIVFAFLFVDMFDTIGTLIGCATKAEMLDEEGKLPHIKGALLADALATIGGAVLGTSTTTTYVESATGVSEGGRTGLTALTTGLLFLLAIIFAPLFIAIPVFATAPALIVVGFYMMGSVAQIDFGNFTQAIPAYLCIIVMPIASSIAEGIAVGVISYVVLNLIPSKGRKKPGILMIILAVLFVAKYVIMGING